MSIECMPKDKKESEAEYAGIEYTNFKSEPFELFRRALAQAAFRDAIFYDRLEPKSKKRK